MSEQNLEFILINNFKCRRCGSVNYDKMIYTGMKTLSDENSIVEERYVCRNCNLPFTLVKNDSNTIEHINISSNELINYSINNIQEKEEN